MGEGVPSTGSGLSVSVPAPTLTILSRAQTPNDGSFKFAFTNNPGALFSVLTTTNLALPLSEWTVRGGVTEISPGQFQFTDPQAAPGGQRFYRLRSP
jgi:hypothetical protein